VAADRTNWFDRDGQAYARYRPDYPPALARFLTDIAPDCRLALDVGCGNGQFTCLLADRFEAVLGIDPSADQIAHATAHERVRYVVAPAENLPVADRSASLIAAAQAAHWFDLPRFHAEVRRVGVPGAILALVTYGVPCVDADLHDRFMAFYRQEVGGYWPPERALVESGYAGMAFPFAEIVAPPMDIVRSWSIDEFLGYVSTWSATRRALAAGQRAILTRFAEDLARLWGDPARRREVRWPITLRLGLLD